MKFALVYFALSGVYSFDFAQVAKNSQIGETQSTTEGKVDQMSLSDKTDRISSCDFCEAELLLEKKKNGKWQVGAQNMRSALTNQTRSLIACQRNLDDIGAKLLTEKSSVDICEEKLHNLEVSVQNCGKKLQLCDSLTGQEKSSVDICEEKLHNLEVSVQNCGKKLQLCDSLTGQEKSSVDICEEKLHNLEVSVQNCGKKVQLCDSLTGQEKSSVNCGKKLQLCNVTLSTVAKHAETLQSTVSNYKRSLKLCEQKNGQLESARRRNLEERSGNATVDLSKQCQVELKNLLFIQNYKTLTVDLSKQCYYSYKTTKLYFDFSGCGQDEGVLQGTNQATKFEVWHIWMCVCSICDIHHCWTFNFQMEAAQGFDEVSHEPFASSKFTLSH